MYKAKNVLLPKNIQRLFQIVQNQRYETRQTGQFSVQYFRKNFKSMSVSVYGVKLWNSLNDDWKTCNNEYYYPYRAFGGQNKIVYSTRFVRRAIFF